MPAKTLAIVGAWKLLRFEFKAADGRIIYPFGEEAAGSILYDSSGRYSPQLMRIDRPQFTIPDQMKETMEEMEANYKGCISYFGRYDVDIKNQTIVHHVEGSIFPNMQGKDQIRHFELKDNRLQLTTPPINLDGTKPVGVLLWERII